MKYVYEAYGKERVCQFFKTNTTYIWDAVNQSLGVSPREFEINWIKWIFNGFNVTIPPEYLEKGELETLYDELLAKWNNLLEFPDLNRDNIVDIYDAILLANGYGKTA